MDNKNELNDIELEFEQTVKAARAKINEKLAAAEKAVSEAVAISEQMGVPFYGLCQLRQTYTPYSFSEKFGDVDPDFVADCCETYVDAYGGWEHSDIC